MKIKEVESMLGITKANIRYYEKEGLLTPARNAENNYREYSPEDIRCLERVKTLRLLGISIAEIKQLNSGQLLLTDVMENRLKEIHEEELSLLESKRICESIIQNHISFSDVNEALLDKNDKNLKTALERIWHEDITKETINNKQLHRNIAVMLLWGYLINIIVSGLFGGNILALTGTHTIPQIIAAAVIGSICYMGVYFTANIRLHLIFFHVSVLILTPLITNVYTLFRTFLVPTGVPAGKLGQIHLFIFWIMIFVYTVLFFCLISRCSGPLRDGHIVLFSILCTGIMTLIFGFLWKRWLFPAAGFLSFTLYIGTCWNDAFSAEEGLSRYHAVNTGCRILNICGAFWNMHGKTTRSGWVRR